MKANRKFTLGQDEEAVSPVIAVILMVAITVVLAATVYVWVSGFSGSSGSPAKTMAMTSAGSIGKAYNVVNGAENSTDQVKNFTVSSATSGMKYSDIKFTLDGVTLQCQDVPPSNVDSWRVMKGGSFIASWVPCADTNGVGPDSVVSAGDRIEIYDDGGSLSGKTLRILDSQANSVILTITIG